MGAGLSCGPAGLGVMVTQKGDRFPRACSWPRQRQPQPRGGAAPPRKKSRNCPRGQACPASPSYWASHRERNNSSDLFIGVYNRNSAQSIPQSPYHCHGEQTPQFPPQNWATETRTSTLAVLESQKHPTATLARKLVPNDTYSVPLVSFRWKSCLATTDGYRLWQTPYWTCKEGGEREFPRMRLTTCEIPQT